MNDCIASAQGSPRGRGGASGRADFREALFVHGLAATGASFERLAPFWRAPTRCVCLDMPWSAPFAGAPLAESWPLLSDNAEILAAAIDRAGGAPDLLVAHSFGGLIVLEALSRRLIAKPRFLVLVSPFYRPRVDRFTWETLAYYVNDFHLVLAEGLVAANRRLHDSDHLHDMALKVRERVGPIGWMHFFRAYLASPLLDLGAVDMPVLAIAGAKDISAFPEDALSLAAALPRGECVVFEDNGHFAFLENPERFIALIERKYETAFHNSEQREKAS